MRDIIECFEGLHLAYIEKGNIPFLPEVTIGKIFVYKHCFCYLNVQNVKQKDSLFHQPIVLWLAY